MRSGSPSPAQAGFTYLAMLLAVAVIGIGLAATSEVWVQSSQREKERELLFVGNQYRRAITLYYERTGDKRTCPVKCYPEKLEDLLLDKRQPGVQRYLRKLYPDPLTGKVDWQLMKVGDGIMGVYSKSQMTPIKTSGFLPRDKSLEGANHFSDWKFLHELKAPPAAASGKPPSGFGTQSPFQPVTPPLKPPMGSP
jgi:type II secretory pathway pseudopilin PulG